MFIEPSQAYTGHLATDRLCEKARRAAMRLHKVHYLADGKITRRCPKLRNMLMFGETQWWAVVNGVMIDKVYR